MRPSSVYEILDTHRRERPQAVALMAPGRRSLSYEELGDLVDRFAAHLRSLDIGSTDRVAVVMPNGAEMAAAFIATAAASVVAPLNPAYREAELDFSLTDLDASALVVAAGGHSPAVAVAARLRIPRIELTPDVDGPAGRFTFIPTSGEHAGPGAVEFPGGDDTALLLHTSGTTARPKLVPLSHGNLCSSSQHIADTLRLTPEDCGLNVMPLFHVHGLVGVVLSSLWAGASVVCTPGFSETAFFDWVEHFQPTWYSAVPTMHQAVVRAAATHPAAVAGSRLRLARSASWALAPQTARELAATLDVPVIEAYGMTEAVNQICSNPLPPGQAKFGTVGLPAGAEVAIMNTDGHLVERGCVGEVVIRGATLTRGYVNDPDATARAFVDGWFHTGDEGHFDEDGYLILRGRSNEIINRGGENISPREIDEALLGHPSVKQAVAFAVPHPTLGQDVAAAVVPAPGHELTEKSVRAFAFERLADFKVPSRVLIVDTIPTGAIGKVQRLGLADQLGDLLQHTYRAGADDVEEGVIAIWQEVLGRDHIGADDNFFVLGGDSLRATQVVSRVRAMFGLELPITTVFVGPTVEEFADAIRAARQAVSAGPRAANGPREDGST